MISRVVALSIVLILSACQNKLVKYMQLTPESEVVFPLFDSLQILHPGVMKVRYTDSIPELDFFDAYSNRIHTYTLEGKLKSTIVLPFPDSLYILNYQKLNDSSVLILSSQIYSESTDSCLFIWNTNSEKKQILSFGGLKMVNPNTIQSPDALVSVYTYGSIQSEKGVFLSVYPRNVAVGDVEWDSLENSSFGFITDDTFQAVPIKYPSKSLKVYDREHEYANSLQTSKGDVFITFPFGSGIHKYSSDKKQVYSAAVSFFGDTLAPLKKFIPLNERPSNNPSSLHFAYGLNYDEISKTLIRTLKIPEDTYKDPYCLQFFDENLDLKGECILPSGHEPFFYQIDDRLYFFNQQKTLKSADGIYFTSFLMNSQLKSTEEIKEALNKNAVREKGYDKYIENILQKSDLLSKQDTAVFLHIPVHKSCHSCIEWCLEYFQSLKSLPIKTPVYLVLSSSNREYINFYLKSDKWNKNTPDVFLDDKGLDRLYIEGAYENPSLYVYIDGKKKISRQFSPRDLTDLHKELIRFSILPKHATLGKSH